jgi:hypothetical protein
VRGEEVVVVEHGEAAEAAEHGEMVVVVEEEHGAQTEVAEVLGVVVEDPVLDFRLEPEAADC